MQRQLIALKSCYRLMRLRSGRTCIFFSEERRKKKTQEQNVQKAGTYLNVFQKSRTYSHMCFKNHEHIVTCVSKIHNIVKCVSNMQNNCRNPAAENLDVFWDRHVVRDQVVEDLLMSSCFATPFELCTKYKNTYANSKQEQLHRFLQYVLFIYNDKNIFIFPYSFSFLYIHTTYVHL